MYKLPLIISLLLILPGQIVLAKSDVGNNDIYHVRVNEQLSRLQVQACFNNSVPEFLEAGTDIAPDLIIKEELEPYQLTLKNSWLRVNNLSHQGCVDYSVDLKHFHRKMMQSRFEFDIGHAIGLKAGDWLWLPDNGERLITIRFNLPWGVKVTTPWPMLERNVNITEYEIDPLKDMIKSWIHIGYFEQQDLKIDGTRIRLAILGGVNDSEREKLVEWITYGVKSMFALYGKYPLTDQQVVIFAIGPSTYAVPWGEIKRHGGNAAHLYVDQTRSIGNLIKDWTLIHELCHMIHPFINLKGRWLSEGIATYYQNVIQARVGTLSEVKAWKKLHEGFQRGINKTEPGINLIEVSSKMRKNRNYMRVYWSGVALALKADWILRKSGQGSLDEIFLELQDCCLDQYQTWTPEEFIARLDELSGTRHFSGLYNTYAYSDQFPDLEMVYHSLGLTVNGDELTLDDNAIDSSIRKSIMQNNSPVNY